MDSASGIRFFKDLKGIQNKPCFVGSILIRLKNVESTALIDMIEKYFDKENISYSMSKDYYSDVTRIIVKNYNMPLKDDIAELLDKCIVLSTYLGYYFLPMEYISVVKILFLERITSNRKRKCTSSTKELISEKSKTLGSTISCSSTIWFGTTAKPRGRCNSTLLITKHTITSIRN